jgi:outer membrane PBP1 activator LpoA protein
MLRLQLAAADDKAKQNQSQVFGLEEEMHNLKQAHVHQVEELQRQIVYLEAQARAADDRTSQAASLVGQLRIAQASHEKATEEAVARTQESLTSSYNHVLKAERRKYEVNCSLQLAIWGWDTVHETCEMELNVVRDDRVLLALFLTQLDEMTQVL